MRTCAWLGRDVSRDPAAAAQYTLALARSLQSVSFQLRVLDV